MRGIGGEGGEVRRIIPRLHIKKKKMQINSPTLFLLFRRDQSTVAHRAETTVNERSLISFV